MNIPYTLLSNQNHSKNLVVFLPGTGYTVQSPLFHYVKDLFSQRDFDVLQINYQYKDKAYTEIHQGRNNRSDKIRCKHSY